MTLAENQLARQKRINASIIGLVADPRFRDFIETVRESRDMAVMNLVDGAVIQSDRASTACIGEIAAYISFIKAYDEAVAQAAMAREEKV